MNHQTIHAAHAPAAVGPYCHAMLCGDTLYTSGQLGLIPETGVLPEGVVAQAKQALDNLGAVLQAAGMTYADLLKIFAALPSKYHPNATLVTTRQVFGQSFRRRTGREAAANRCRP